MADAEDSGEDYTHVVEALSDGWVKAMGVTFTRVRADEVVLQLVVSDTHRQPLGLVHGGVLSGMVETAASIGAAVTAMRAGHVVVGLDNHTSFLRAVREGTLQAVGRPLVAGRRSHVWEVRIHDESARLVARGQVRLLLIEQGSDVAGAGLSVRKS